MILCLVCRGDPKAARFYKGSSHNSCYTNDLLWQQFVAREEQQLRHSADELRKKNLEYSGHQIVKNHGPSTKPIFYNSRIIARDGTPRDVQYQSEQSESRQSNRNRPATSQLSTSRSTRSIAMLGRSIASQSTPLLNQPVPSPIQTRASSRRSSRRSYMRPGTSTSIKSSARSGRSDGSDRSGLSSRQMGELRSLIQDQVKQFADHTSLTIGELRSDLARETKHTQEVQQKLASLLEAKSKLQ